MQKALYSPSNRFFENRIAKDFYHRLSRPYLAAYDLRTPENAGSMIRLADNLGAGGVSFIQEKESLNLQKIKRTAASSLGNVDWKLQNEQTFFTALPAGYSLVAIETAENAQNLFETQLPEKAIFLAGSERYGLPDDLLKRCDMTVYIPMPGTTKSMNITHSMAVVLFEWLRQMWPKK